MKRHEKICQKTLTEAVPTRLRVSGYWVFASMAAVLFAGCYGADKTDLERRSDRIDSAKPAQLPTRPSTTWPPPVTKVGGLSQEQLSPEEFDEAKARLRESAKESQAIRMKQDAQELEKFLTGKLKTLNGPNPAIQRLASGRKLDYGPIQFVVSHDVTTIFGSHIREIGTWNVWTRESLAIFDEPHLSVDLAMSFDGRYAASAGSDYQLRVWNAVTGRLYFHLPYYDHPSAKGLVAFTEGRPDGLVYLRGNHMLRVNPLTGEHTVRIVDGAQFTCLASNGTILAWGDDHGDIMLEAAVSDAPIATVSFAVAPIALEFSHDGKTLAAMMDDGTIRLMIEGKWDKPLTIMRESKAKPVLAISHDGQLVAVADARHSFKGSIEIWKAADGTLLQTLEPSGATQLSFLGNDAFVFGRKGLVAFRSARTGEAVAIPETLTKSIPEKENKFLHYLRNFDKSLAYARRRVASFEQGSESNHTDTLSARMDLGDILVVAGRYAEAIDQYKAVVLRCEEQLPEHSELANQVLGRISRAMLDSGEGDTLVAALKRIREQRIQRLGEDHLLLSDVAYWQAFAARATGSLDTAEQAWRRCLTRRRAHLEAPHAKIAETALALGEVLHGQGKHDEGIELLSSAVKDYERVNGTYHATTFEARLRLVVLQAGSAAQTTSQEVVLATIGKEFNELDPSFARQSVRALNMCGRILSKEGKQVQATCAFRRALAISEREFGPNDPDSRETWQELAQSLAAMGENFASQRSLKRGTEDVRSDLAIKPDQTGEELDAMVQQALAKNELDRAELLTLRAMEAHEAGGDAKKLLLSRFILGRVREELGFWDEAMESYHTAVRELHRYMTIEMPLLSDEEKLRFAGFPKDCLFFALSAFDREQSQAHRERREMNQVYVDRAAEWVVNMKAMASESILNRTLLARESNNPVVRKLYRELTEIHSNISALVAGGRIRSAVGTSAMRALSARRREVEKVLGKLLHKELIEHRWVTLEMIRNELKDDTCLIEMKQYKRFNYNIQRVVGTSVGAWLIPPIGKGRVRYYDQFYGGHLEDAVGRLYAGINNRQYLVANDQPLFRAHLQRIYEHTLEGQLEEQAAPYEHWLICPDGVAWLIPWSGLPRKDGKFLIETKQISCLVSCRDLVRRRSDEVTLTSPVIFADPDYNFDVATQRYPHMFGRLPGTAAEAVAITPHLRRYTGQEPRVYTGDMARESTAKKIRSPSVAVFSTHGYYNRVSNVSDPFSRTGLALASANGLGIRNTTDGNDGILTGLEVANLDFRGTRLAVLSACETALGARYQNEALISLRQSFHLAGTESVVAALWPIPDEATAEQMSSFFAQLAEESSPAVALRKAQLAAFAKAKANNEHGYGPAHPIFWAGFVLTGYEGKK